MEDRESNLARLMESSHRDANWEDHLDALEAASKKARYKTENWQLAHYVPEISNFHRKFSAHPVFGRIDVSVDPVHEELKIIADVNDILLSHRKHLREN